MKVVAIVPAAGKGRRIGDPFGREKPYLILGDKPILAHTLIALSNCEVIDEIVAVVSESARPICQAEIIDKYALHKVKKVIIGGLTRSDSVFNGLKVVDRSHELVLIHDGNRPFVTEDMVNGVVKEAAKSCACILAVRVAPTVKEVDEDLKVVRTLERSRLWAVQTPQAFRRELILRAYESAGEKGRLATDDSTLVERLGQSVKVIEGSSTNIKITTLEDLEVAQAILRRGRV